MSNEIERRYSTMSVELRAEDDSQKIVGYGAVFDSRSENLGGFTEIIAQGAFDDVLSNDVRGLFNHDPNFVLGRSTSGTLKLSVDDTGLRYEITPPDTQTIRDLVIEPLKRGDITGSSFGFMVDSDDWSEDDDTGAVTRTINKVSRLLDVSPVTYPAYPDADVALRSLHSMQESKPETKEDDVCESCTSKDEEISRLTRALDIRKRISGA